MVSKPVGPTRERTAEATSYGLKGILSSFFYTFPVTYKKWNNTFWNLGKTLGIGLFSCSETRESVAITIAVCEPPFFLWEWCQEWEVWNWLESWPYFSTRHCSMYCTCYAHAPSGLLLQMCESLSCKDVGTLLPSLTTGSFKYHAKITFDILSVPLVAFSQTSIIMKELFEALHDIPCWSCPVPWRQIQVK